MDVLVLAFCSVLLFIVFALSRSRNLPPGPWGLPLIGHLHLLGGKQPHEALNSISQKFGPIIHLRLGMIPTVVVSSPSLAREIFTKHDVNFCSRPYFVIGEYVEYGSTGLGLTPYGEHYRGLCTTELFTSRCIDSFAWARDEAVSYVFKVVLGCHSRKEAVDLRSCLSVSIFNAITQIVCSKSYFNYEADTTGDIDPEAMEFKNLLRQIVDLSIKPCLSNFVPWYLRWLDWQVSYYKQIQATSDKFLQKIVDEHKTTSRDTNDFVDMLLSHFGQRSQAETYTKATLVDMFGAGIDTSVITSEWLLAAVIHNPRVMKKVQEELDNVVGESRMVRESDLPKLDYFHAVVKETMRRYPTGPLLLPRMSTCDTKVGGYHVPKGTTLIVSSWAIGMDPSVWKDPTEFIPERFVGSSIDYKGQDFELLPFGSGRRKCPGMALGLRTVELLVANLLHGFDWELGMTTPQSMEAVYSSTCMLKTPLQAIATPRLANLK